MSFSLADVFYCIVIFQLFFISFFLFSYDKGKRPGNILLGAFFLCICLNLADNFLLIKKVYYSFPSAALWSNWLFLLLGPLLYLYTQSILYRNFSLTWRKWIHFVPFIVLFLVTEAIYLGKPGSEKLTLLNAVTSHKMARFAFFDFALIFLQFSLYIMGCFIIIRRFKKIAGDQFSDSLHANISWLSSTLLFFSFCMAIAVINGLIGITPFAKYVYFIFTFVLLLVFIFINRVLLKALKSSRVFSIIDEDGPAKPAAVKYQGSALDEGDKTKILAQLKRHMENQKPYLEPELTLDQLAAQLSIKPTILSQVINDALHQNFFDFVNRYRIEEARRMLTNPADKKITVLEVLYRVGFNSKSSFNLLFKRYTGQTPKEFKKNNVN